VTALKLYGPIRWVTAASPKYLKKHGVPEHPKDLLAHKCIRMKYGSGPHIYEQWEFVHRGKEFSVRIQGPLILNDFLQIVRATLDGCGISYGYYNVFKEHIEAGRLKLVLENYSVSSEGFYFYYPKRSQVLPKLRAFIDHLKEHA
jgi:DNA-binding transcriptional LysR family regulator